MNLFTDIVEPLAEFLETSELYVDLDREVDKQLLYGFRFRKGESREQLEGAVEQLVEDWPQLFDLHEAKKVPLDDRGEWLFTNFMGNISITSR